MGLSLVKSPVSSAAVGTRAEYGRPARFANPSQFPNKKNRFFFTGPPRETPYWFCTRGGRSIPVLLLKKLFAFRRAFRKYSYAVPCTSLVPDLVEKLMTPP